MCALGCHGQDSDPSRPGPERCLHGAWTELLLEESPPARDMEGEVCGPRRALHTWPGSVVSGLCSCVFVPPSTVRLVLSFRAEVWEPLISVPSGS